MGPKILSNKKIINESLNRIVNDINLSKIILAINRGYIINKTKEKILYLSQGFVTLNNLNRFNLYVNLKCHHIKVL